MSIKKQGGKGSLWASATKMSVNVLDFAVYAYLARILPLDIFGFLGVGLLVIEFTNVLVNAGINQNLIQRKEWDNSYTSSTFSLVILSCIGFSLVIICFAAPLAYNFYSTLTGWLLFSLAGVPILSGLEIVFKAKLQRDFKNKKLSQIYVLASVIASGITLILAIVGWGVWSIIVGKYVNSSVKIMLLYNSSGVRIKFGINRQHLRELWLFIKPMLGSAVLTFLNDKSSNILTAAVIGPSSFAILNVAKKANRTVADSTVTPINSMMVPMFSRVLNDATISDLYIKLVTVSTFVIMPIFMGLAAVADPFVTITFGEKFAESANYMTIMSFTMFPAILAWYLPNLLIAKAQTNTAFKLTLLSVTSNVLVSAVTIWFGITTMLASIVFINFILLPVRFRIINRYIHVDFIKLCKNILPQYISAFLMFLSVYYIKGELRTFFDSDFLLLVFLILVGGALYPILNFVIFKKHTLSTMYEIKDTFFKRKQ